MKKLLLISVLLSFFAAASLFAWEPNDLTKFPSCTKAGDFVLDLGAGFGPNALHKNHIYIPPVRLTGDVNIAIGDKKLPFFAGGIVGYSGEGYKDKYVNWYYSMITAGGRFGYHFNWRVDNLDTYAVASAGWTVYAGDIKHVGDKIGDFFWGTHLGARYYLSKGFGFWVEAGYSPFSWIDAGLAFKF